MVDQLNRFASEVTRDALNIIVLPILFEDSVRAVLELASFSRFSPTHHASWTG